MVALRQILDWGVPEIASTLAGLTAKIADEASRLGLEVPPVQLRAPHLIGLRSKSTFSPDLPERLGAEGTFVSVRGRSIRVSPHLYNTAADVDRLFAVLGKSLCLAGEPQAEYSSLLPLTILGQVKYTHSVRAFLAISSSGSYPPWSI